MTTEFVRQDLAQTSSTTAEPDRVRVIREGVASYLSDIDADETSEWLESFDGLLERSIPSPNPPGSTWVPVVPDGQATVHLTWKRWLFLQCHCGILGGHRNVKQTLVIVGRQVWWVTMKKDVP